VGVTLPPLTKIFKGVLTIGWTKRADRDRIKIYNESITYRGLTGIYYMAMIQPSPYLDECAFRYYVVHDRAHPSGRNIFNEVEEERVYGIVKIPTKNAYMGNGKIEFYNDTTGQIGLLIREVSEAEWGTYQAFELFPTLHVFAVVQELHQDYGTTITISRVRFNDH